MTLRATGGVDVIPSGAGVVDVVLKGVIGVHLVIVVELVVVVDTVVELLVLVVNSVVLVVVVTCGSFAVKVTSQMKKPLQLFLFPLLLKTNFESSMIKVNASLASSS